jgi:phage tail sheath gpL-like
MSASAEEIKKRLEDEITALIEEPPDPAAATASHAEALLGVPVTAKVKGDRIELTWEEEGIELEVNFAPDADAQAETEGPEDG